MSWKNWPYWLKGGLTGLVIGILMAFIWLRGASFLNVVLIVIINFFLIGALIGWIYNRIKSKKKGIMKAWLKGGLIGGAITFILLVLDSEDFTILLYVPSFLGRFILDLLVKMFCKGITHTEIWPCEMQLGIYVGLPILLLLNIFWGFLIGAIIGFIIGKIKSKSKEK